MGRPIPMLVFLSAVLLPSVSAGGVYCAKTARARAAALGLYYPGVHAAPRVYGPAQHGIHSSRRLLSPQPYQNNRPASKQTRPDTTPYASQSDVRSLDDRTRQQAHSRTLHGTSSPAQSDYHHAAGRAPPRGRLVVPREPHFEQVKRVVPPTLALAPGRPDLVARNPQGRGELLPFVYSGRGRVVDESAPDGRDVSARGLLPARGGGHGAYPSSIPGRGLARAAPVLRSSGSASSAAAPGPTGVGFSGPNRLLNVKQRFSR